MPFQQIIGPRRRTREKRPADIAMGVEADLTVRLTHAADGEQNSTKESGATR